MSSISLFQIQKTKEEEQFWLSQLTAPLPETTIPFNGLRPKTQVKQTIHFTLPNTLTQNLLKISKNIDLSLYLLLLSTVQCVLLRYTGQKDSLIASPLFRPLAQLNQDNLVLIQQIIEPTYDFKTTVLTLKNKLLKCYENQYYPYEKIIKQRISDESYVIPFYCGLNSIHDDATTTTHDIAIWWNRQQDEISCQITYQSLLFNKEKITRFFQHYVTFLTSALNQPEVPITQLQLLPTEELQQLNQWSHSSLAYPTDQTIVELFEQQVKVTPDRIAVTFQDKQLTYQQLNELANNIAHELRQQQTLQVEECVAFWLTRSEQVLVVIWGILKAGAAYIPLDPGYPIDRVEHILQDSSCHIILTDDSFAEKLAQLSFSVKIINIHQIAYKNVENLPIIGKTNNLAYIIYTSGSTGKPKGVMIEHGSLVSLVSGLKEIIYRRLPHPLREALAAAFVFDLSVKQLFVTLVQGNTLCLVDDEVRLDPKLFIDFLHTQQINFIDVSPAFFAAMLEYGFGNHFPPTLHHIIVGSESVPPTLINTFYQHEKCKKVTLTNMYGPTENCAEAAYFHLDAHFTTQCNAVPIGKPIPNTQALIVDEQFNLVPIGIPGELCISGPGLARGYLNDATMTASKFVLHPFQANARLYRTGDVCCWSEQGEIEYLGRNDDQVKIRGFRIELGEIENRLLQHFTVKEAVVLVKEINQQKELVAYLVGQVEVNILRDYLKMIFPVYMVPGYFVILDKLPLNISGKIDKKMLPEPNAAVTVIDPNYRAARSPLEQQLVEIWQTLLNKQPIGIDDNFFDLGGHSIKATQLVSKVYKALKIEINLRDIFTFPTITELVEIISAKQAVFDVNQITPISTASYYDLSHAQRRLWLTSQLPDINAVFHIHDVIELTGQLNFAALQHAWQIVVTRHESLRTTFMTLQGEPKQQIHEFNPDCALILQNMTSDTTEAIQCVITQQATTPFDLGKLPLVRVKLLKVAEQRYLFTFTMHHIIGDGWSIDILIKELFTIYQNTVDKKNVILPALTIQYKDYAAWQKHLLNSEVGKKLQQFWQQTLSKPLPILQLATDFPRLPDKIIYGSECLQLMLDQSTTTQLHQLAKQQQVSLFMVLVALVRTLLYRYTAQEDVIIGTAIAGRNHPDLQEQIGFYVNMLPLRIQVKTEDSFINVLNTAKNVIFAAQEHQLYPFDKLVAEVGGQRERNRFPLFDVVVDLQDEQHIDVNLTGLSATISEKQLNVSEYDLAFLFIEQQEQIELHVSYHTHLFNVATITTLIGHFEQLLNFIIMTPEMAVTEVNLTDHTLVKEEITTQFNF